MTWPGSAPPWSSLLHRYHTIEELSGAGINYRLRWLNHWVMAQMIGLQEGDVVGEIMDAPASLHWLADSLEDVLASGKFVRLDIAPADGVKAGPARWEVNGLNKIIMHYDDRIIAPDMLSTMEIVNNILKFDRNGHSCNRACCQGFDLLTINSDAQI